jgi:Na+-translocating ferredoxin:NAD+ oxidoreductase RnfA subunit
MDFLLDLLQALGVGAAIGIRPGLSTLLVGVLASADLGVDYDGTDFAFLEEAPFLFGVVLLVALSDVARRRLGPELSERGAGLATFAAISISIAMLEGAGTMADRDHSVALGLLAAGVAAVVGFFAARSLFGRVRQRLDAQAQGALPVYGEAAALAAAGLSILFPPLAIPIFAALVWLLMGGRRREGEKYAGLRVLR